MAISQLVVDNDPVFARHETFHPRYGWLRKAVYHADHDSSVFVAPNATVTLGVGKNMVNAIRFWGQAFKLLQSAPNPTRPRLPHIVPTQLGRAMFAEDGWDPYLEAPGTLWVLHWWLLAPTSRVPVWWLAFNSFNAVQFSDLSLAGFAMSSIDLAGRWSDVLDTSVKKDADCLIRMYAARRGHQPSDELVDCPFRELGLIEPVPGEARTYRFVIGSKPSLPDAILAYCVLDFMSRNGTTSTISIARLTQDVGSPGRLFRLTESAIHESLKRTAERDPTAFSLTEPAGVRQFVVRGDLAGHELRVLQEYYAQETGARPEVPTAPSVLLGLCAGGGAAAVDSAPPPQRERMPANA